MGKLGLKSFISSQVILEKVDKKDSLGEFKRRPITKDERRLIKRLQEFCTVIHDGLKRGKNITVDEINELFEKLKSFKEFSKVISYTIKTIGDAIEAHGKMLSAPERMKKNIGDLKSNRAKLEKAFLASEWTKADAFADKLKVMMDEVNHHVDAPAEVARHLENMYTNKPTIFGTVGLLEYLGNEEYEKIKGLDLSKPLYTTIDAPVKKLEGDSVRDLHYLMYFAMHLSAERGHHSISSEHDFRKHIKVKYANNGELDELLKLTDKYLHGNQKTLIPKIRELIDSIPEVKEANDRQRKKIKVVYRGVVGDKDEEDGEGRYNRKEVLAKDRESRYVATSTSWHAAKNFALRKGHLEAEESRRSKVGYMIRYGVTPDAIVFDTGVIETTFNEDEVLIDVTKATVEDIDQI